MSQLVTLYLYPSRMDAEVAKTTLDAFDVKSFISADDAGGLRAPPFSYTSGAELIVKAEDLARARELLGL
jgi:hypothetical protein